MSEADSAALPRAIVHADLDAFFASVEQRDDPALRGQPVLVGGRPEGRGVVAAASYEARRFGVRSAMPMRTALRLCPRALVVAPRFETYAAVSAEVMAIFRSRTALVEPLSLDEAFLDMSGEPDFWPRAKDEGRALKAEVRAAVGLTLSVGVATTKSAAKVASDLNKPDGLVVVRPGHEGAFLEPLPVRLLSGVGPRAQERLAQFGVTTIGGLARLDPTLLQGFFGRWGLAMAERARGIDPRPVSAEHERKSVGRETTFAHDITAGTEVERALEELCDQVSERLERRGLHGRTVTLKVRRADFTTHTRQRTLPVALARPDEIRIVAARLAREEIAPETKIRLIGVAVSGFADERQLPLFPFW